MKQLYDINCTIMRGGTSKGVFVNAAAMPPERRDWDNVICSLFGSPDRRQIDGLGGADPLTSKIAIIGSSSVDGADVDYTFGQVSIGKAIVDYNGNCGNLTAAVGPFSIEHGYVKAVEPVTEVRIYNTNTSKLLRAYVPVVGGKVIYTGDYCIAGVPGTAARIDLDFADTKGSATGKLLPTGNCIDILDIDGIGKIRCSIVDIANPVVFLKASDLELKGVEQPGEIDADIDLLEKIELIRATAAAQIGMCDNPQSAINECPAIPLLAIVSKPKDSGISITSRLLFMQITHKTYSATAAICTGVALKITGTIPHSLAIQPEQTNPVVIEHPAGQLDVKVSIEQQGYDWNIRQALVGRTARKIMEGRAFYTL